MNDYFRIYPTDIDFHAKTSNYLESNPFDENDSRHGEWVIAFNKHHNILCKESCCG